MSARSLSERTLSERTLSARTLSARTLSARSLVLVPTILLAACHVGGGDRAWRYPADVDGVDVKLTNGSVTALPATDGTLRVEWSGGGVGNERIHPEPTVVDGVVYLDARCGDACGGDVTVWLPEGVGMSGMVDRGDVSVELPGRSNVRACAAMGSVYLDVPGGAWDMELSAGVGEVWIDGVEDDASAADRLEACVVVGDLTIQGR